MGKGVFHEDKLSGGPDQATRRDRGLSEERTFSHLVVIGSSAGGIEALSELVSTLPEGFSAPIVVAQHLDPERASHLEEILSRRSTLPVRTVSEHEPLEAGVIFVVPANRHVNITDSEIDFKMDACGRPMPSVDLLFSSGHQINQFAERRRAERERDRSLVREREARRELAGILESISDAFFAVDREWRLTYVNRRAEQLWSKPREELLGRNLWEHFPQAIDSELYRAMEERITTSFEVIFPAMGTRVAGRAYPSPNGISVYVQDITERKKLEEERERLLALEWIASAQVAERERISRELHDRVAHSMGVVHQNLQLYEALTERDPSRANSKLELAQEMAKTALESTRNLSAELRRSEAEDDLAGGLRDLLEVAVPPGVQATLAIEGDESLVPSHVRGQVFLILREAVRNAVTHSGCSRLTVGLEIIPDKLAGCVEDDGRGFEPEGVESAGVGLRSMKERTALLGGEFRLSPGREAGTKVVVSIPLAREP
jgi:PAS domain S-box-containing protein